MIEVLALGRQYGYPRLNTPAASPRPTCKGYCGRVVHGHTFHALLINLAAAALCVNNSETSSLSTISVGAEKDSHLHEQDQW